MAHELYNQLSKYLDASYRRTKNYQHEVDFILRRVGNNRGILIDVACGSGGHAELLSKAGFEVYAVDLNDGMLRLVRKNLPKARVFKQDMRQLDMPVQADVLICMYNSINYNYSYDELTHTFQRFYDHLKPGGVLIFDTAFMKHTWKPGPFSVETITTPSTFPIQNAAVLSPSLWDVRNAKHSPIAAFLLRLRQPPGSPATQGANDEHGDQRIMHDSRC